MESSLAVEMKELVKAYGDQKAVKGINLEIGRGECFGLLGPNGAGKSTTMRMMYGSNLVTSGELYVLGLNVKTHFREIKARIGVVPQDDGLDPDFTVLENLLVYASYNGIKKSVAKERAIDLLRLIKLDDYQNRSVDTLSGGMRRRLAIARGLINDPELVILDEPTTGLDPQARIWIWDFFRNLKNNHKSIILTTHYMEEAENLCDRVAIMDHGEILTVGQPHELISKYIGHEVVEFETTPIDRDYYLGRLKEQGFEHKVYNDLVSVFVKKDQTSKRVLELIASDRISIRRAALNDVFLKLAGYQVRDEN